MKVVYHIGEEINPDTVVKKGILVDDPWQTFIEDNGNRYIFDDIRQVDVAKISLGTMIKVVNGEETVFLAVPRIFIDRGTGFLLVNYFATKKAGRLLADAMWRQKGK